MSRNYGAFVAKPWQTGFFAGDRIIRAQFITRYLILLAVAIWLDTYYYTLYNRYLVSRDPQIDRQIKMGMLALLVAMILLAWISIRWATKPRLRDAGISPRLAWWCLLPFLGWIVLIWCFIKPTVPPDPRRQF